MWVIETAVVAFSMYSAIPMPRTDWNERNMRYAMCAFPLVGLVVGLLEWGFARLAGILGFSGILAGAGLCLLPLIITGGIHMDGFADTWDALASQASPERRQEILKDPHIGAFGAMHLGMYLIASFALWASLRNVRPVPVIAMFCLSRSLSGLSVTSFRLAKSTGIAHAFASAADKKRAGGILLALAIVLTGVLAACGRTGTLMAAAAWAVFAFYRRMAERSFGGLSGDLAGWFLETAELLMLAVMCVMG